MSSTWTTCLLWLRINQVLFFLQFFTCTMSRMCIFPFDAKQSENVHCQPLDFFQENVILTGVFAALSSPHPPIPLLNKPSSSSSSHFPDLLLMLHMRNERGMGGKMNETGSGEWKGGVGGRREQDWEKCPLTGFKSLWHFIFRERGASSPSDPLRANLID